MSDCLCCLQIHSIAALFGVRTFQSQHPERFHEKYHLTQLVKRPEAGILTLHGDMLVSHTVTVTVDSASIAILGLTYLLRAYLQTLNVKPAYTLFPTALCVCFLTISVYADLYTEF